MTPEERAKWRHDNIDSMRTRLQLLVRSVQKKLTARGIRISRAEIIADLRVTIPQTKQRVVAQLKNVGKDPDLFDVCASLMDEVYEEMLHKELN